MWVWVGVGVLGRCRGGRGCEGRALSCRVGGSGY